MQNFGRFWTTSDFDREYPRNGPTYPKSENVTNYGNSSCVWWKRSGELWSTNGVKFHVSLDPLKCTFLADYFSPSGVLRPEIFTSARDWPSLDSAHPKWDRGPPKNSNRENLKFGLKFSVCTPITSGLVGISSWNFSSRRVARQRW